MALDHHDDVDVFVGVDVGKGEHHAVALDRVGKRLLNHPLPNDETRLREMLAKLLEHGRVLLVVHQPATIGALPLAVGQAMGVDVIADLHLGEAKTDAKDAAIIADAARTLPHALRSLQLADEQIAELAMFCGFDDDLVTQVNQLANRIRRLLTQIHPALERVLGPRITHPGVLDLLQSYPTPAAIAKLGRARLVTRLRRLAPRMGAVP